MDREAFGRISDSIEASQNAPIGVLGIPVGAYVDIAKALANETVSPSRMIEALLPFLVTYGSAIRRCMEDKYHWEILAFPFHPAEPDVLGVLFCVEATLRRREQGSLLGIIRDMPLGEVATNLLYNSILEQFEGH